MVMLKNIIRFLFTFGVFLSWSLSVYAGGNTGGGNGCIFKLNSELDTGFYLLDFVTNLNSISESTLLGSNNLPIQLDHKSKISEPIQIRNLPAYQTVINRLELWTNHLPATLSEEIYKALNKMEWRFTSSKVLKVKDSYFNESKCESITPVVIFTEDFGAIVSTNSFNQLNNINQAGLILHEALRFIQINYDFKLSLIPLNTDSLQKITTYIMLKEPTNISKQELDVFIFGNILEPLKLRLKVDDLTREFKSSFCPKRKNEPEIFNTHFCDTNYFDESKLIKVLNILNHRRGYDVKFTKNDAFCNLGEKILLTFYAIEIEKNNFLYLDMLKDFSKLKFNSSEVALKKMMEDNFLEKNKP